MKKLYNNLDKSRLKNANKNLAIRALFGFNLGFVFVLPLITFIALHIFPQVKSAIAVLLVGDLLMLLSLLLIYKKKYDIAKFFLILVPPYTIAIVSIIAKYYGFTLNVFSFLVPKVLGVLFLMSPVIFFGLRKKKNMIIGFVLLLPIVLFFDTFHSMFGIQLNQLTIDWNFYPLLIGLLSVFYTFVLISMLLVEKSNLLFKDKIIQQKSLIQEEFDKIIELNHELQFQSNLYKILEITSRNKPLVFILQGVLDEILELQSLKIKHKGLIFLTNQNGVLNIAAHTNVDGLLNICSAVKKGQCLCGKVLESKEKMFCNKVNHKHDIVPENMQPHGHYVIPIKRNDEVLGVINIYIEAGQSKNEKVIQFLEVVASILARKIIAENNKEKLKKQQIEIVQQSKVLESTLNELNESIAYAQFLQQSLMPNQDTINRYFKESCVLFMPKDKVSGDFYFAHDIEGDLYFGVGDCTGHGVPGSMLASMSVEAVKYLIEGGDLKYPDKILNELREVAKKRFSVNLHDKRSDSMDAGMCMYDRRKDKLYFSGGFLDLVIVRNNNELIEYKGTKCPIGTYPVEYDFELHEIDLQEGDVVYLSSDGFVDQFGYETKSGKPSKFKRKRFRELLIKISSLPCNEQVEVLKGTLNNWRRDVDQIDDVTVFVAKH